MGILKDAEVQVHGFSDASRNGLAAIVYLRVSNNNRALSSLLCAKTKVEPLKRHTIPRLELLAFLMLTRLISLVLKTLNLSVTIPYMCTDSSIVYTWVTNHPSK